MTGHVRGLRSRALPLAGALVLLIGFPGAHAQQNSATSSKGATVNYDRYQASQRQRLRIGGCLEDEDMIAQYCVKRCEKDYVVENGTDLPRRCRSLKPLPPGQLASPMRLQRADPPKRPPPSKPVPGA